MLIERIELENIKSYRHLVVDWRRGTTAISGENGAGKTTLVEAIGFALFDYLPYSQVRFVREGEKYGRVVVHLVGGDERPYIVERRCGSGSRWFIHDDEANLRIEQSADVLDKLHELFGIDRERPLASLFRDALGVPQGTFTAIFLESASKRKQTFDTLLQIEDYKTAADNLLETQKQYKEQMHEQTIKINQLSYETRLVDEWRAQLKQARQHDEEWKLLNVVWTQQLAQCEEQQVRLNEQYNQLQVLSFSYETSKAKQQNACELLHHHEQQFQSARAAQQVILDSQSDHQRYLAADSALQQLRGQEQQRNTLRTEQAKQERDKASVQATITQLQVRLQEVAQARLHIVNLAPLVEQQLELEQRRDELLQRVNLYEKIVGEGKQLSGRVKTCQLKKEELEQKIKEIEPLVSLSERLSALEQAITQLKIQRNEHKLKTEQLQKRRVELQGKHAEREQLGERLRKAEQNVILIEEHRSEAEEMPGLQTQSMQFSEQRFRLEGNIEGYTKSRAESAGGQCPLLNESCLNIKQRGMVSLEAYFERLLTDEHAQLLVVNQQQDKLNERMAQIKKYADALNKLDRYIDQRDNLTEQAQRIANEITRLAQEVAGLEEELKTSSTVDQRISEVEAAYKESKLADAKVRDLPGLKRQVQQYQDQLRLWESDLQELRRQVSDLSGSDVQLKLVREELTQLNDPRAQRAARQAIIDQEGTHLQHLQDQQQREQAIEQQLRILQDQLAAFQTLDSEIALQEVTRQQCQRGYHNYLKNIELAQTLPARERIYKEQLVATEVAQQILQEAEQAYQSALTAFDEQKRQVVKAEIERLHNELSTLAEKLQRNQLDINEWEKKISEAEEKLVELAAAQQEYQTLEDLYSMLEYFRKLIKEAAPQVLKAMLNNISAEANRIFGEIMGDRSAQLSWQNDYEIILRRQGVNRAFAQLSGGEQMSAALAVRLALLKKLSTLNIAFFDEPTQNMDELRRMNLADQIRRVRGFEQLIVISHDDTFEQGLDSLIRLRKTDGVTHLVDEDGMIRDAQEAPAVSLWSHNGTYATQS